MISLFSIARLLFYIYNYHLFESVTFLDVLVSIWFDIITGTILFLPLVLIELFPNPNRNSTLFKFVLKTIYLIIIGLSLIMNLADIEYFKHASSRSTFSTLKMLTYGNDLNNQLPSFIKDYWLLFLSLIIFLLLASFLYNKLAKSTIEKISLLKQFLYMALISAIFISIGRGWTLRPIAPINIIKYTSDQNVPLVLNSAFTIIKSLGKNDLEEKKYYDSLEIKKWFDPINKFNSTSENKPNIVLIMIESFSIEYISGINNDSVSYTPFLDSLINEGLVFTNCYANGKKSIDAVPSVVSSIPKLLPQEFITSQYATNTIESLPKQLKTLDYYSMFFHGASNGSMNFDQFTSKTRYDAYMGRNEYNNDKDFDGTWGIFDHLFMDWSIDQMNAVSKPFFSTIFTLSSHPPYTIPDNLKEQFTGGPTKMHNSVKYTDYSLKLFFEKAKLQDWYNNTIFIITADHTPASSSPMYFRERGNMHIPLLFFQNNNKDLTGRSEKIVSQNDIMPTILDLVGYEEPFFSFGKSVFSDGYGFSVSQVGNKYLIFGMKHFLVYQDGKAIKLYQINDLKQQRNLIKKKPEIKKYLTNKLLAYIQTYNHALITNKMIAE